MKSFIIFTYLIDIHKTHIQNIIFEISVYFSFFQKYLIIILSNFSTNWQIDKLERPWFDIISLLMEDFCAHVTELPEELLLKTSKPLKQVGVYIHNILEI